MIDCHKDRRRGRQPKAIMSVRSTQTVHKVPGKEHMHALRAMYTVLYAWCSSQYAAHVASKQQSVCTHTSGQSRKHRAR